MIRIAVGTSDMQVVCDHLARSSAFVVMEIEEGKITSRTVRDRGTDACGNHKSFVELLRGCDAVLCGGIGQGVGGAGVPICHTKLSNHAVDGEDLGAGEAKAIGVRNSQPRTCRHECRERENQDPGAQSSEQSHIFQPT